MNDGKWKRRLYATLLVGALFRVIIAFGPLSDMPQTEDGPSYRQQALEIIDGKAGYFYFPPGTAIASVPFYAVFGRSIHVDHAVAVTFWMLFTVACAAIAWQLCSDKRQAWIATIMAVFLPHGLLATCTISSQPLTAALFAASICLAIVAYKNERLSYWTLACILMSMSVITRPATLLVSFLAAGALLVIWKRHSRIRARVGLALMVLTICHVAVMLPVMSHNASQGQGYTLSTNNEWNLLVGNNPFTPDYKTGHFGQRTFDKLPDDARAYLRQILPHEQPAFATLSQRACMKDSAVAYIANHPIRTLYRVTNRFRGFWGMDYTASREIQNTYGLSGKVTAILLFFEGAGFLAILVLWLTGMLTGGVGKPANQLTLLLVAASMAPYLVAFSVAKYHTVVLPLLFPLSAGTLLLTTAGSTSWGELRRRRRALTTMIVIMLFIQAEHVFHIVDNR